jgi:hypothetical protein
VMRERLADVRIVPECHRARWDQASRCLCVAAGKKRRDLGRPVPRSDTRLPVRSHHRGAVERSRREAQPVRFA